VFVDTPPASPRVDKKDSNLKALTKIAQRSQIAQTSDNASVYTIK